MLFKIYRSEQGELNCIQFSLVRNLFVIFKGSQLHCWNHSILFEILNTLILNILLLNKIFAISKWVRKVQYFDENVRMSLTVSETLLSERDISKY